MFGLLPQSEPRYMNDFEAKFLTEARLADQRTRLALPRDAALELAEHAARLGPLDVPRSHDRVAEGARRARLCARGAMSGVFLTQPVLRLYLSRWRPARFDRGTPCPPCPMGHSPDSSGEHKPMTVPSMLRT